MDVGKDVRRRRNLKGLADVAYKEFINGYLSENMEAMYETMDLIREGSPVQWMKLNIELMKLGMTREQNININFNRQQDRENLQALVRTRIPAQPDSLADVPRIESYTPYEEIKPAKKREST